MAQGLCGKCLLTSTSSGSVAVAGSSLERAPNLTGAHADSMLPSHGSQSAVCVCLKVHTQAEPSTSVRAGEGIRGTWNASKNLADPDEQVLGDLPPDRQWRCVVQVVPNHLRHRLVGSDVLQAFFLQDSWGVG